MNRQPSRQGAQYRPSTLQKRKGKYYVCVTKPKELQFGADLQVRRSTGTSDKRQAQYLQHELTREIYDELDRLLERSDPFFEKLRPIFEREGVKTRDWYTKGLIRFTISGERSLMHKLANMSGIGMKGAKVSEDWEADNHVELCMLVTLLGHAVPTEILYLLPDDEREKIMELTKPRDVPPKELVDFIAGSHERGMSELAETALENAKHFARVTIDKTDNSEADEATLHGVVDRYLDSRPEKSRARDRIQLRKWMDDPDMGKKPLADVNVYDVYEFLNDLGEDLSRSSVKVFRAAMSNVYTWCNKQRDLGVTHNPWRGIDSSEIGKDAVERVPFSLGQLNELFQLDMPEDYRKAFAILVTTGLRGGELVQLSERGRVEESDGIRYLDLREINTKNKGSKRLVPLHDAASELPEKFTQQKLNKLVREITSDPRVVVHSLRHTAKDLFRDAGISKEVSDFITGHAQGDVSGKYGVGPSLKARYEAINRVSHPWLK